MKYFLLFNLIFFQQLFLYTLPCFHLDGIPKDKFDGFRFNKVQARKTKQLMALVATQKSRRM
jgi:hypothetical protein